MRIGVVVGGALNRALRDTHFGDVVCESSIGWRTQIHAELGSWVASEVGRTVQRVHARPGILIPVGG